MMKRIFLIVCMFASLNMFSQVVTVTTSSYTSAVGVAIKPNYRIYVQETDSVYKATKEFASTKSVRDMIASGGADRIGRMSLPGELLIYQFAQKGCLTVTDISSHSGLWYWMKVYLPTRFDTLIYYNTHSGRWTRDTLVKKYLPPGDYPFMVRKCKAVSPAGKDSTLFLLINQ